MLQENIKRTKPVRTKQSSLKNMYSKDGFVYLRNDNGEDVKCFMDIQVTKVLNDLITRTINLVLSYSLNGEALTILMPRKMLTKANLLNVLPQFGVEVYEKNIGLAVEWLLHSEQLAEREFFHTHLGWQQAKGMTVCLFDECVSLEPLVSRYVGPLDVSTKGSFHEYMEMIRTEVRGNLKLELATVIGLSALVTSYLRGYLPNSVSIYHFFGDSTTGKSISASLALSGGGRPLKGNDGLMKTFLSTDNGIFAYMKNKHGVCFCLDESSSRFGANFTYLLYNFSEGTTKIRSTVEGDARDQESFSGSMITTGENSMLGDSAHSAGLRMRVTELTFDTWTESAQNAKSISATLSTTYGHTAKMLAKHILELGKEDMIQRFQDAKEYVIERFTERDRFLDRISDKIGVLYLTAILANEAIGLDFNPDGIIDLVIESESLKSADRDIGRKAYEALIEFVNRNPTEFCSWETAQKNLKRSGDNDLHIAPRILKGRIDLEQGVPKRVYFDGPTLQKVLSEQGFASPEVALTAMKSKGYLIVEKDGKRQVKRKLSHDSASASRVYGFVIEADTSSDKEGETQPVKIRTIVDNSSSKRKIAHSNSEDLFSDDQVTDEIEGGYHSEKVSKPSGTKKIPRNIRKMKTSKISDEKGGEER